MVAPDVVKLVVDVAVVDGVEVELLLVGLVVLDVEEVGLVVDEVTDVLDVPIVVDVVVVAVPPVVIVDELDTVGVAVTALQESPGIHNDAAAEGSQPICPVCACHTVYKRF